MVGQGDDPRHFEKSIGERSMAKTHTSTEAKRRYNNKVYQKVQVELPKDLVERFKERCRSLGVSQASIIKEAIERFLGD